MLAHLFDEYREKTSSFELVFVMYKYSIISEQYKIRQVRTYETFASDS